MKECRTCKYNKVDFWDWLFRDAHARCTHTIESKSPNLYTTTMRSFEYLCGKEGKLWEPKK